MKALVFRKPTDVRVERVPDPRIENARDAIVRVTAAAVCAVDLDVYAGRLPQARPLVLGHEFTGVVEEVGPRAGSVRKGARVIVPYCAACGDCWACRRGLAGFCERPASARGSGVLFGQPDARGALPGGQAQYVRVPFADAGLREVPPEVSDEDAVFLGSVVPAAWTAAERCGLRGGETVAVFGCGPVGIMAMKAARRLGAARIIAVDPVAYRRRRAREIVGAEALDPAADPVEAVRSLTDGRGADACIDAVGLKTESGLRETFSNVLHRQTAVARTLGAAVAAVRPGGAVSVAGVLHGAVDGFPAGEVTAKGLRLLAGRPSVHACLDRVIALAAAGELSAAGLVTHRLPLDEAPAAYEMLEDKLEQSLKVVLEPWSAPEPRRAESAAAQDEIDVLRDDRYSLDSRVRIEDTSLGAE